MTAIYTFVNHKGGAGKTTLAIHVATALALRGRRVLVVDLDPQGNATEDLGAVDRDDQAPQPIVKDALIALFDESPIPSGIVRNTVIGQTAEGGRLDVVGADMRMEPLDTELSARDDGAAGVAALVEQLSEGYDAVVVDTRPSFGALTRGGILASDLVVVVASMRDHGSLRGLQRVAALARSVELAPEVVVLRNFCDMKRVKFRRRVERSADEGLETFDVPVLKTRIPALVDAEAARADMHPVLKGPFAGAVRDAAIEMEQRLAAAVIA